MNTKSRESRFSLPHFFDFHKSQLYFLEYFIYDDYSVFLAQKLQSFDLRKKWMDLLVDKIKAFLFEGAGCFDHSYNGLTVLLPLFMDIAYSLLDY